MKPAGDRSPGKKNVKIADNGGGFWRESSYEFWRKDGTSNGVPEQSSDNGGGWEFYFQQEKAVEDPPSKLIGEFLHKQQGSGDFSLDMDLEMQELKQDDNAVDGIALSPVRESPLKTGSSPSDEARARVSFHQQARSPNAEEGQVLRCTFGGVRRRKVREICFPEMPLKSI